MRDKFGVMKKPITLTMRLWKIENLSDFARKSGIPRRTLDRLKMGKGAPAKTTILAVSRALAEYVPTK